MSVIEKVVKEMDELREAAEERIGMDEEAFKAIIGKVAKVVENQNPDWDEDKIATKTRMIAKSKIRQELRSPAEMFEGIVLGASDPFDMVARARAEALQKYNQDPEKAVQMGIVNEDGEPIDVQGKFTNQPGVPYPETSLIRNVWGVTEVEGDIVPFKLTLQESGDKDEVGDIVKQDIPINVPVRFRANDSGNWDDDARILNMSTRTDIQEADDLDLPDVEEIYEGDILEGRKANLSELEALYEMVKDKYPSQRWNIFEGTATHVDKERNRGGSYRLALDSDDLDVADPQVTVFVEGDAMEQVVDFGPGTEVFVNGQVNQIERNGEVQYNINAIGIAVKQDTVMNTEDFEAIEI